MSFIRSRYGEHLKKITLLDLIDLMKGYQQLDIFIESKRLAIEVHTMTLQLPKFELYEQGSQLRRSSKSIVANIVEGYGKRRYKGEYVKHLTYSHAECDETLVHLEMIRLTHPSTHMETISSLTEQYVSLSKKLYRFIRWIENTY